MVLRDIWQMGSQGGFDGGISFIYLFVITSNLTIH